MVIWCWWSKLKSTKVKKGDVRVFIIPLEFRGHTIIFRIIEALKNNASQLSISFLISSHFQQNKKWGRSSKYSNVDGTYWNIWFLFFFFQFLIFGQEKNIFCLPYRNIPEEISRSLKQLWFCVYVCVIMEYWPSMMISVSVSVLKQRFLSLKQAPQKNHTSDLAVPLLSPSRLCECVLLPGGSFTCIILAHLCTLSFEWQLPSTSPSAGSPNSSHLVTMCTPAVTCLGSTRRTHLWLTYTDF